MCYAVAVRPETVRGLTHGVDQAGAAAATVGYGAGAPPVSRPQRRVAPYHHATIEPVLCQGQSPVDSSATYRSQANMDHVPMIFGIPEKQVPGNGGWAWGWDGRGKCTCRWCLNHGRLTGWGGDQNISSYTVLEPRTSTTKYWTAANRRRSTSKQRRLTNPLHSDTLVNRHTFLLLRTLKLK